MKKFNKYPKYKESGVEWVGEIPEEWQRVKLNALLTKVKDGTHGSYTRVNEGELLLSAKNVDFGKLVIAEEESEISEDDFKEITSNGFPKKGDLLFTIVGTIGRVYLYELDYPLAFQRSVAFLRFTKEVFGKFYYYFMQSQLVKDQILNNAHTSAQSGLYINDLKYLDAIKIPLVSQKKIAFFLDKETSSIDAVIEKQRQFIELLKEKRAAVITHAVTKGIDPNSRMKPSGVEWIGDIPEGWSISRLKFLLLPGKQGIKIGPFGSAIKLEYVVREGYKIYGQENIIDNDFKVGDKYLDLNKFNELINYEIHTGDLLLTMMGTIGDARIVPEDIEKGIMDSHLIRLRFWDDKISIELIQMLLHDSQYIYEQFKKFNKGSIMEGLNSKVIKNLIIALPPREIQEEIIKFIKNKQKYYTTCIEKTEKWIELMQEYKQSLITAAVTGKIDVREAV